MAKERITTGANIFVNGVKIDGVAKYNVAEGWVEAVSTSPTNYSNIDLSVDMFVASRLYGHVEVEYK